MKQSDKSNNQNKLIIPIDAVNIWEKNPREISDKDFQSLKGKIKRWGLWKPFLVWESKKQIIGGNQRYKACKELGYKEVWVEYREPKDEAEALEMAITDNESSGEWIKSLLIEQIKLDEDKINFEDYKINISNSDINGLLRIDMVIPTKGTEIEEASLGSIAILKLKYEYSKYLELLELLQNAQEKLGCYSNEEVIERLLEQYK